MTPVSRWFIKAGLLWLLLGGLLGGLFLVLRGLRSPVSWYAFVPAHGHIMFVGFVVHLIMAVAVFVYNIWDRVYFPAVAAPAQKRQK